MEPILRDVPKEVKTKRLIIRPLLAGDGEEWHAAIVESADRLRVTIPCAKPPFTMRMASGATCTSIPRCGWTQKVPSKLGGWERNEGQ